ncbi:MULTISPECIES: hypothetical protein [Paenibacillus]|uniref:DUF7660 family protein n=1 Tax=Paenibacillus TaxID=44249 RepID=UPI002FE03275
MDIQESSEAVRNKEDFINFVYSLIKDLKQNTDEWENTSLEDFLHGMASWVEDTDGLFPGSDHDQTEHADWNRFAAMLFAGSRYE